jgi:type III secretion protein L
MSSLIKSGDSRDLTVVRPFNPNPPPVLAVVSPDQGVVCLDEEKERLHRQVEHLENELSKREAAIAALRADVMRAFADGKSEGRDLGLAEAEDRQSERHALLESALNKAHVELTGRLASLDRLALLLAQECLEIILGDRSARSELLHRILELHISRLDKSMLVAIELSPEDFDDQRTLTELPVQLGVPSVKVHTNPDIPSGGCVMNLRLGRMDVGLNQQWSAVRDLLGDLARPEEVQ